MSSLYGQSNLLGMFDNLLLGINRPPVYFGFDVREYPGNEHMEFLWNFAPEYRFAGYYLRAPSHQVDTSWMGTRAFLQDGDMDWGLGIIYLGQQDPTIPLTAHNAATLGQAHVDMLDAIFVASSEEHFPDGYTIYLDIEQPAGPLSQDVVDYAGSWVEEIIAEGSFNPGIYCSHSLYNRLRQACGDNANRVRFWTTGGLPVSDKTYQTGPSPPQVGQPEAANAVAWQVIPTEWDTGMPYPTSCASNPHNYNTWHIDRDISTLRDPSAP